MFTSSHREQLETEGWTVVPGVVSEQDCDRHIAYLRNWLGGFQQWPQAVNSLIQRYKAGHLPPAWEVRLASKPVFTQIWGTSRLLTSFDAIAIGRPPEQGSEQFWHPATGRFRSNQTAEREGLHSYQGQVNLEACDEDDWTYEVLQGSHRFYDHFMESTQQWKCIKLEPEHIAWFEQQGCTRKRVVCPKGGMLLCDSRLFRADARPLKSRRARKRWRMMVYVCMTPASWATVSDLAVKRKAYEKMLMTTHWPSQKISVFTDEIDKKQPSDPYPEFTLPEVARTDEAKKLAGVMEYNNNEEDPEFRPTWNEDKWAAFIDEYLMSQLTVTNKNTGPAE